MDRNPTHFASQLQAAVGRDGFNKPIYDPVIATSTGRTYSLRALVESAARGDSPSDFTSLPADETFCVNRLLVMMMRHFNIGVPDAAIAAPAQFWPQPVASTRRLNASAPPQQRLSPPGHPFASQYGEHMQGLWALLAADACQLEMERFRPQLEATLVGHAHILFSSHSGDYHEAFNAGLNVNPLIDSITILLRTAQGPSLVAGLRVMRADCFYIIDNDEQAIANLGAAFRVWPQSLSLWGREQRMRELLAPH